LANTIEALPCLRALGINVIELMPLEEFSDILAQTQLWSTPQNSALFFTSP
jgi:pullulanase/glycogen debranching enzyme